MKQTILLLSATPYSMRDEEGRINEGISVRYLTNASLAPIDNGNGSHGGYPAKGTLPMSMKSFIQCAPAVYDADLDLQVASDGKVKIAIKTLEFVSTCNNTFGKK